MPPNRCCRKNKGKCLLRTMKRHGVDFSHRSKNAALLLEVVQRENTCLFCLGSNDNQDEFGELIHHKTSGISVHYFCLLLASNLEQTCNGPRCDVRASSTAIYGFRIKDILLEFERGSKLICSVCHRLGATIGCCLQKCRTKFHFNCALQRQFSFQYFGSFPSFCRSHRPVQSSLKPENECKTCFICLEDISLSNTMNVLRAPCCNDTYFHRECVKKQALSSGLYFFRCPTCNNKEDYTNEMLRMGIFIPDRDASWETPEAFSELLERATLCGMPICKCENGRKYDKTDTMWSISLCVLCGSSGAHKACAMLPSVSSPYVCEICYSVFGQTGVRKTLLDMGFETSNAVTMTQRDCTVQVFDVANAHEEDEENQRVTRSRKRKREKETITTEFNDSKSQKHDTDQKNYIEII